MSASIEHATIRRFSGIDAPATGRTIRRLRMAAGYTVRQVQEVCGLASAQAVYKWQWGEALPSLDNMAVLARLLEVKMEDIIVFSSEGDCACGLTERK